MTSEIKRSFEIISYAGEARTHAFNALAEAKKGNIKEAEINNIKKQMSI